MRPTQFSAETVVALLRKQTVASLTDVMAAFGPRVSRRTAFRKLKDLHARTSYSHRGGYYTLDELADFDEHGLWTFAGVRFSRAGTLVATAEAFVNHAEAGHFVDELDNLLGVGTQDALRKLVGDGRLTRHKLAGHFLYCATDHAHQTHQLRARRLLMATPGLGRPLPDAEGYVSWAEYERNQRVIADNAARYGLLTRGAVRRGEGLLAGLLRCGHCGRRLHVAYSGINGKCVRYSCRGAHLNHGTSRCIAFGGMRVDAAVANEVLRLLRPLGIEAALKAIAMRDQEHADRRHHAELALTRARYEADLARRQYDAVDPANRLVGAELERRWNERLAEVQRQEERVASIADARPEALSSAERDRLLALGADLETVWTHPGATAQTRKRIVRAVLEEIVVKLAAEHIELLLHWRGGDHTHLSVPRNRTGQHRWCTDATVGDLIRGLAHQLPDRAIAATLNRLGKQTGRGNAWTEARVRTFRSQHRVPAHRPGEMAERGELTLKDAADRLGVSTMTVLRFIGDGTLVAQQVCRGAPWAIPEEQIVALAGAIPSGRRPLTARSAQEVLDLQ